MQQQLFQPRSQTQHRRFPQPGLVRSTIPIVCTRQHLGADFPHAGVFTTSLSLFVVPLVYACQCPFDPSHVHIDIHNRAPFVCASQCVRGQPPSCSCRHSQPPPSLPLVCACQRPRGQPCLCQRLQPASLSFAHQCLRVYFPRVRISVHNPTPFSPSFRSGFGPQVQVRPTCQTRTPRLGSVHPDG